MDIKEFAQEFYRECEDVGGDDWFRLRPGISHQYP